MGQKVFMSLLALLCVSFQVAHADLYSDDFDDGTLDGWSPKIGNWSIGGTGTSDIYLSNSSSNYGVIWKDGSFGVNQKVQVDAFFDLSASVDKIAHLRLRTDENPAGSQRFWDTGYLADVQPGQIIILNTHRSDNAVITRYDFGASSPIDSSGWYTLTFEVTGTGSDTHFEFLVNDVSYIDYDYENTIGALDQGYVGLGRKIKYDNFSSATNVAAVPLPTATLLGILGLTTAAAKLRRKRDA